MEELMPTKTLAFLQRHEMKITTIGNTDILKLPKTAFLASNHIKSNEVLRCYDWAIRMRDEGRCVVSGFSSKLERDVFHFLRKGKQPIIIVLARKLYREMPEEWKPLLDAGRLLVISVSDAPRQSRQSALLRNRYVADIAQHLVMTGVMESSSLYSFYEDYREKIISL